MITTYHLPARVTGKDKKHAILLAIKNWPDKSAPMIAEQIGCSEKWVRANKDEVRTTTNLPGRVTGKAAKERQAQAGPSQGKGKKGSGCGNLPQAVKARSRDVVAKADAKKRQSEAGARGKEGGRGKKKPLSQLIGQGLSDQHANETTAIRAAEAGKPEAVGKRKTLAN
ncbi:MAG: hypothetical protein LAP85_29235 [Acidobacteriia bacterium]|nr:hypothetical protein [Terriglobia bacterium]